MSNISFFAKSYHAAGSIATGIILLKTDGSGRIHCEDGPAFIRRDGVGNHCYEYWQNDIPFRPDDKPTMEVYRVLSDGKLQISLEAWTKTYLAGKESVTQLHRMTGPAIIWHGIDGVRSTCQFVIYGEDIPVPYLQIAPEIGRLSAYLDEVQRLEPNILTKCIKKYAVELEQTTIKQFAASFSRFECNDIQYVLNQIYEALPNSSRKDSLAVIIDRAVEGGIK